jgi:hypothetical protein
MPKQNKPTTPRNIELKALSTMNTHAGNITFFPSVKFLALIQQMNIQPSLTMIQILSIIKEHCHKQKFTFFKKMTKNNTARPPLDTKLLTKQVEQFNQSTKNTIKSNHLLQYITLLMNPKTSANILPDEITAPIKIEKITAIALNFFEYHHDYYQKQLHEKKLSAAATKAMMLVEMNIWLAPENKNNQKFWILAEQMRFGITCLYHYRAFVFSKNFDTNRLFSAEPALKKYGKTYHVLLLSALLAIRNFLVEIPRINNENIHINTNKQLLFRAIYANAFLQMNKIVSFSAEDKKNTLSRKAFHEATNGKGMVFFATGIRCGHECCVDNWVELYQLLIQQAKFDGIIVKTMLTNHSEICRYLDEWNKQYYAIKLCSV